MKKTVLLVAAMACCAVAFSQKGSGTPKDETFELKPIIERINKAIAKAENSLQGMSLNSAVVNLETIYDKSGTAGFKFFVKAARKWTKGTANAVHYKYERPSTIASIESKDDVLVNIINGAAQTFKESGDIIGLEKKGIEIEVSFSVTKTTSGGVEFEIFGVGVDGGADWERKVVHTITLEFE